VAGSGWRTMRRGSDMSVCPDKRGGVWVGFVGDGLWRVESNTFRRPFPPADIHAEAKSAAEQLRMLKRESGEEAGIAAEPT
jgi:ligand-binding sensor domain-containing protein